MRWVAAFLVLFIFACDDETNLEHEWIQNEVAKKTQDYKTKKTLQCREELIEQVLKDADSIVLVRSRFDIPDSLVVPEKQLRPGKPEVAFPDFKKPKNPAKDSL
jgi:hypothetical protein